LRQGKNGCQNIKIPMRLVQTTKELGMDNIHDIENKAFDLDIKG
jgi:hypothetical protein